MPLDTFFGSSVVLDKQISHDKVAQNKAKLLNAVGQQKQQQHSSDAAAFLQSFPDRIADIQNVEPYESTIPRIREDLPRAVARNIGKAIKSVPMTAYGLTGIAGATLETAMGEGGIGTALKEFGYEGYMDYSDDLARDAQPEDSFKYSYEQAKKGDVGALLNWGVGGTSYVAAQFAAILTGVGAISVGTQALGKTATKQLLGGLVRKEAKSIAGKKLGEKATAEQIAKFAGTDAMLKAATSSVTKKVGQAIGIGATGVGMELGEIGADKVQQSVERGTPLSGGEVLQAFTAAGLAGAVESMETVLGLSLLKGKLGKALPGVKNIKGAKGRVARGVTAGVATAPTEFTQEYVQTGIEQWGGGHDLTTQKAADERFEGGMLGALGGGPVGLVASFHGSVDEKKAKQKQQAADRLIKAETQPGYDQKVTEAVEKKDVSDLLNPETENYNPVAGIAAAKNISQDPDVDVEVKIDTKKKAYAAYAKLEEGLDTILSQREALRADKSLSKEDLSAKDKILVKEGKNIVALLEQIDPIFDSMEESKTEDPAVIEKLKGVIKASDVAGTKDALLELYGSHGRVSLDEETIKAIEDNPTLYTEFKDVVVANKARNKMEVFVLENFHKDSKTVYTDVTKGGKDPDGTRFKGIDEYIANITNFTKKGKTREALEEAAALEKFAQAKQHRAAIFNKFLNVSAATGTTLGREVKGQYTLREDVKRANAKLEDPKQKITDKEIKAMESFNKIAKKNYSIDQGSIKKPTEFMQLEADLLKTSLGEAKRIIQKEGTKQPVTEGSSNTDTTILEQDQKAAEQPPVDPNSPPAPDIKPDATTEINTQETEQIPEVTPVTSEDKQSLFEMGFAEDQINKMSTERATALLAHKGKSKEQLTKDGRRTKDEVDRQILRDVYAAQLNVKPEKVSSVLEPVNKKEQKAFLRSTGLSNKNIDKLSDEQITRLLDIREWSTENLQKNIEGKNTGSIQKTVIRKVLADKKAKQETGTNVPVEPAAEIKTEEPHIKEEGTVVTEETPAGKELATKPEQVANEVTTEEKEQANVLSDVWGRVNKKEPHHTSADPILENFYEGAENGGLKFIAEGQEQRAPIISSALDFVKDVYETNFKQMRDKKQGIDPDTKNKKIVHTDVIKDLWKRLITAATSTPTDPRYSYVEDGKEFTYGNRPWTDQKVGTEYVNHSLCSTTSKNTVHALEQQQLPAAHYSIGQRDTSGSTNRIGDHEIAITEIDGKRYIVDMPQKEMWRPLDKPKANTALITDPVFKPRFIQATAENLVSHYGLDQKSAIKEVDGILTNLKIDPVIRTAEDAVRVTIEETNEEYGTNFSADFEDIKGKTDIDLIPLDNQAPETLSKRLTTSEKPDKDVPHYEINQVREHTKAKGIQKGKLVLLQHTKNVADFLRHTDLVGKLSIFDKKNPFDSNAKNMVGALANFMSGAYNKNNELIRKGFLHAFEQTFKIKPKPKAGFGNAFRYEDPIQYLVQNYEFLPANVIHTLSAVSFKFLATRGSETLYNDDRSIRAILKIKNKDRVITKDGYALTRELGVSQEMLKEMLGQEAFDLLGIKIEDTADADLKDSLIASLGLQMIATMQKTGYLRLQHVNAAALGDLIEQQDDPYNLKYKDIQKRFWTSVSKKQEQRVAYYKVNFEYNKNTDRNQIASNIYANVVEPYKHSPRTWDLLFKGVPDKNNYSLEPFKYTAGELAKLKKTAGYETTAKQAQNAITNANKSWEANTPVMNAFLFLGSELQQEVMGAVDMSKVSVNQKDTSDGINLGISKNLERWTDWMEDMSRQPDRYKTKFYIPVEFWKQLRMGMAGSISPQGSTLDRSIYKMSEWTRTRDLSDPQNNKLIMLGIGQALKIDFMKNASVENTLKVTEDLLQTEVMQKGVAALQMLQTETDFNELNPDKMTDLRSKYPDEAQAIVDAVAAGKEGAKSLVALVEYAKYKTALELFKKDSTQNMFETSIVLEADGVNNGPAINRLQFWMGDEPLDQLAALESSGFRFHSIKGNQGFELSEHLARPFVQDAYQYTGFKMAMLLLERENELNKKRLDKNNVPNYRWHLTEDIKKLHAVNSLLGSLIDPETGNITKEARDLNKGPTMKTQYGMGTASLINDMVATVILAIEKKIAAIAVSRDTKERERLNHIMTALSKDNWQSLDPSTTNQLLQIEIPPKVKADIAKHVKKNIGDIQDKAIRSAFGSFIEASKTMSSALSLITVYYNVARDVYIEQRKRELEKLRKLKGVPDNKEIPLTVKDMKDIEDKLNDIFPHIETAAGGYMPVTSFSKEKDYTSKRTVTQTYTAEDVTQKHSFVRVQRRLEDPGLAGAIAVQQTDGVNANNMMGPGWAFLNTHDGSTLSVFDVVEFTQGENDSFLELHTNYHIARAMNDTITAAVKGFNNKMKPFLKDHAMPVDEMIHKEITKQFIGKKRNIDGDIVPIERHEVEDTANLILKRAANVAAVTEKNKTKLLKAVQGVSQFSVPGGELQTNNKQVDTINGIPVDEITERKVNELSKEAEKAKKTRAALDAEYVNPTLLTKEEFIKKEGLAGKPEKDIDRAYGTYYNENSKDYNNAVGLVNFLTQVYEEKYGSTSNSKISTDSADYALHKEISGLNVLQVYEHIKNDSTVSDTKEHDAHLKHLLTDLMQKVLQPVDLHLKLNPSVETQGIYAPVKGGKDQVFISSQPDIIGPLPGSLNHGLRMSTGEVYAHEMMHAITTTGLNNNKRLRNQVERLYNKAANDSNLDFTAFLNDPTIDVNDRANRFEVAAAKERYDALFVNPSTTEKTDFPSDTESKHGYDTATKIKRVHKQSNHLAEFVALGTTNKNFLAALTKIETTGPKYQKGWWQEMKGDNIQEMLVNIGQAIMDFLYYKFTSRPDNSNMATELEALAVKLSKIDSRNKSNLFKAVSKINKAYNGFGTKANTYIKKAFTNTPVLNKAYYVKQAVKSMAASDGALGQQYRDVKKWYSDMQYGFTKALVTEVSGETPRLSWIHELLNTRKTYIDAPKNAAIAAFQKEAENAFTKLVDAKGKPRTTTALESAAVTRIGLRPDTVTLLDFMDIDEIGKILKNEDALQKRIDSATQEISKDSVLSQHLTYYTRASDATAHYMVTGQERQDEIAWLNVRTIAELVNTEQEGSLNTKDSLKAQEILERLITLKALQYTAKKERLLFAELIKKDPQAVNNILNMHGVLKKDAQDSLFEPNDYRFIKGYTKSILNPRIEMVYGTLADKKELEAQGFTISKKPVARDSADPTSKTRMYAYTSRMRQINDYVSMTASLTDMRSKGVSSRDVNRQLDVETLDGISNRTALMNNKRVILKQMSNPNYTPSLKDGNHMVPLTDRKGKVVEYRHIASQATMDTYLEQNNEYSAILGSMAGQTLDKARSPDINRELVHGLKIMYDKEYANNPGNYVEVSPYSKDAKLREIYYMCPEQTREDIKKIWGSHRMFIAKDTLAVSFGYRKYSITEAFTKDPAERAKIEKLAVGLANMTAHGLNSVGLNKINGVKVAYSTETLMKFLTSAAKNSIVVKSLTLTLNNMGSNFIYLKSRDVPVSMIVKHSWEAFSYGIKYQTDIQKLDKLKIKNKVFDKQKINPKTPERIKLTREITQLEDSIWRNPTRITIEAGLLPTLLDDVETAVNGTTYPNPIEVAISKQTDKLPTWVQRAGKEIAMTQDTQIYKLVNNAVKMSDFIGRHVLYTYYTTTKGKDHKNHKEAVAAATHEFVNFNLPTHRMVDYLNEIGLLWFTRYAVRIQRIIVDALIDKPFTVVMSMLLATELGWDNINNSSSVISNPLNKISLIPFKDTLTEPITMQGLSVMLPD